MQALHRVKLSDGKTDGNNISFNRTLDFGGQSITMAGKGVLSRSENGCSL
jgi:hypothetical protein